MNSQLIAQGWFNADLHLTPADIFVCLRSIFRGFLHNTCVFLPRPYRRIGLKELQQALNNDTFQELKVSAFFRSKLYY